MLLPKQLKPRLDFRCFVFTGRDIDTNTRKSSLKKMQQDSESKESKSHTQRRFLRAHYLVLRTSQDTAAGHFSLEACTQTLYCEFNINQTTAYV